MKRSQPIEIFMPPNMLKAKVGGGLGGPDMAAMKRAEAALDGLKEEYPAWIAASVRVLGECRAEYARTPDDEARDSLLGAALDIKSQAPDCGFPLLARLAASLARLIESHPAQAPLPAGLVDAHVGAIQAIHRDKVQDDANPMALTLCMELEKRTADALAAIRTFRPSRPKKD